MGKDFVVLYLALPGNCLSLLIPGGRRIPGGAAERTGGNSGCRAVCWCFHEQVEFRIAFAGEKSKAEDKLVMD